MKQFEIRVRSSAVPVTDLAISWEYPETEEGISYGTPYYWVTIDWDKRPADDVTSIDTYFSEADTLDEALADAADHVAVVADMRTGRGFVPVCMVNVTELRYDGDFSCGTWEPCQEFLARHQRSEG